MKAAQALAHARRLGVVLTCVAGKLCYEAPKGRLTQELRQALVAHKTAILELLTSEQRTQRQTVQCRDCAHYVPVPPIQRASGAAWEMPGDCSQGRTSPETRPPIYPCTGWYCDGWTAATKH
jgi:hypothetical protein